MHELLCICDRVPALAPHTRLALIVHHTEWRKPTNTGRIAVRACAGATVHVVGDRARPLALPIVPPGARAALLFPADDAAPLTADFDTLVVPDGNWRQAAKFRHRIPGLSSLPCVHLPSAPPTRYQLRSEPREGGLATLEAIAHALRILEPGPAVADALLEIFRVMVDRTLWLRGALSTAQVHGGVPPAALELRR
jgi:DTW domain-containing protein YfiP